MNALRPAMLGVAAMALAGAALANLHHPRPTIPAAHAAAPSPFKAGARILLSPAMQREARDSGTWLHDVRSVLPVDRKLEYGDYRWDERGVPAGDVWVRVDLRTQLMSVIRAGHEIGTTVVLYGADAKETPTGVFPILWKGRNHRSSLYDAEMPFTMRLTGDGVAIHGSDVRWGAATHGCIGVPTAFAARLFEQAGVGTPVEVVRSVEPAGAIG